jgi:hypothetical protein
MDRQVRSELVDSCTLTTQMQNPLAPWGDAVILELKYSEPMPPLFVQLVRDYELKECGAAKYVQSINLADKSRPASSTATT